MYVDRRLGDVFFSCSHGKRSNRQHRDTSQRHRKQKYGLREQPRDGMQKKETKKRVFVHRSAFIQSLVTRLPTRSVYLALTNSTRPPQSNNINSNATQGRVSVPAQRVRAADVRRGHRGRRRVPGREGGGGGGQAGVQHARRPAGRRHVNLVRGRMATVTVLDVRRHVNRVRGLRVWAWLRTGARCRRCVVVFVSCCMRRERE